MKNCLLPHAVTYYRFVGNEDGAAFQRFVLDPVRLRIEREKKEGDDCESARGVLYVFPGEQDGKLPDFCLEGDFFVPGILDAALPPRDGSAFRVIQVTVFDSFSKANFLRLVGVANGGESDE